MSRGPQPDSLTSKVRKFFSDNPDEELSIKLIARKFDCSVESARQAVLRVGELENVHVVRLKSKVVAMSENAMPLDEVSFPEGTTVYIGGIPFLLGPDAILYGRAENREAALQPLTKTWSPAKDE